MIATATENLTTIRPQLGPQENFLTTPADIAIYGGAAGGGKTWALMVEALRNVDVPGFYALILRSTSTQVRNPGGLWDKSMEIFPNAGGTAREYVLEWDFPAGSTIKFGHLEHEKDLESYHGAELAYLAFDELPHFSERQFWYMLKALRSTCGVVPYVRASCNPDADSWVANLIAWWIDQDTGIAIPERSGVVRWFVRVDDRMEWGDSEQELRDRFPWSEPKSLTFIAATLEDNRILMRKDPGYRAMLMAMSMVDRERMLGGNWKIRPSIGNIFREPWFLLCGAVPATGRAVRYWDKAGGTSKTSDYSAGVLVQESDGEYYIADVVHGRWTPKERNDVMLQTAELDVLKYGRRVELWIEQEPGHNAKESRAILAQKLVRFAPRFDRVVTNKVDRAKGLSAAAESKLVHVLIADWTKRLLDELCAFPNPKVHDDQVDASSGAFSKLVIEPERRRAAPQGRSMAHAR